jgi:hypothetical protein
MHLRGAMVAVRACMMVGWNEIGTFDRTLAQIGMTGVDAGVDDRDANALDRSFHHRLHDFLFSRLRLAQ